MQQKLKTSEEAATPDDYFNQVVLLHSRETKGTGQQKRRGSCLTKDPSINHSTVTYLRIQSPVTRSALPIRHDHILPQSPTSGDE